MSNMTYENTAYCPLCLHSELEIIERHESPDLGPMLLCRCSCCGNVSLFSEEVLKGSAKRCAESLRENTPDDCKKAPNNGRL